VKNSDRIFALPLYLFAYDFEVRVHCMMFLFSHCYFLISI
jgi:hypothetical protein